MGYLYFLRKKQNMRNRRRGNHFLGFKATSGLTEKKETRILIFEEGRKFDLNEMNNHDDRIFEKNIVQIIFKLIQTSDWSRRTNQ
jgi:hypothetical protein